MNKITVILNDYGSNIKSIISYDRPDIQRMEELWDQPDEHLKKLQVLEPFSGYEKWSELTPNHYRILISRGLNTLAAMTAVDRGNSKDPNVAMTNFMVLAFIHMLEKLTFSEIEHFRINRFDELNVTFDYSASFEVQYDRPLPKVVSVTDKQPSFSIVVDNLDDPSED